MGIKMKNSLIKSDFPNLLPTLIYKLYPYILLDIQEVLSPA